MFTDNKCYRSVYTYFMGVNLVFPNTKYDVNISLNQYLQTLQWFTPFGVVPTFRNLACTFNSTGKIFEIHTMEVIFATLNP